MNSVKQPCGTDRFARSRRRGFTLVELLVVIAVIGVLIAMLLSAVQSAREAARRTTCKNKLRQQAIALQTYYLQRGYFPPGGAMHTSSQQTGVSWRVSVLPFLEESALFAAIGPAPNGGATSWAPQSTMPEAFRCPSDDRPTSDPAQNILANYAGVGGAAREGETIDLPDMECGDLDVNGLFYPGSKTRAAAIADGTSNTLALGEQVYVFRDSWMSGSFWRGTDERKVMICAHASKNIRYPINADTSLYGYFKFDGTLPPELLEKRTMLINELFFGSLHPGGAHFALADASVQFLPDQIDFTVYQALATAAGGELNEWEP